MSKNKSGHRRRKIDFLASNPVARAFNKGAEPKLSGTWINEARMHSHGAMTELIAGRATRAHLGEIVAVYNMARLLLLNGYGQDMASVIINAESALKAIAQRSVKLSRYVLTGPEISALNLLLELHDAQLDIVTAKDVAIVRDANMADFSKGNFTQLPGKHISRDPVM